MNDDTPETIGEFYGRLPDGEWVEAYGFRFPRWPTPIANPDGSPLRDGESVTIERAERLDLLAED